MNNTQHLSEGELIPGTRYRVVRLLGSGGMGSVYEVEHLELGKRFVLKTLLSDLSARADLVQRLRNEWRALGKLEHPNIVRVSDAGVAEGNLPYFVMERLKGETLSDRLATRGKLELEPALKVAIAVLDALSVAHSIGIVHRDVKPPNIFLTTQGNPKLLDFGIAKLTDASTEGITARGVAVGTPRYMSPEQAAGEPVDLRADLYAVGLVLFEMVSGTGPYRASDANELFLAHLTQPAPLLSTLVPAVPAELDQLVAQMLAKSPDARPSSARQAGDGLRAIYESLRRRGVVSGPPPGDTTASSVRILPRAEASAAAAAPTAARPPTGPAVLGDGPPADATLVMNPDSLSPTQLAGRVNFGNTQPALDSRRRDDAFANAPATRTAVGNVQPAVAVQPVDFAGTPPPVSSSPPGQGQLRRWMFPAVVLVLAAVAVALVWPRHSQSEVQAADIQTPEAASPPRQSVKAAAVSAAQVGHGQGAQIAQPPTRAPAVPPVAVSQPSETTGSKSAQPLVKMEAPAARSAAAKPSPTPAVPSQPQPASRTPVSAPATKPKAPSNADLTDPWAAEPPASKGSGAQPPRHGSKPTGSTPKPALPPSGL